MASHQNATGSGGRLWRASARVYIKITATRNGENKNDIFFPLFPVRFNELVSSFNLAPLSPRRGFRRLLFFPFPRATFPYAARGRTSVGRARVIGFRRRRFGNRRALIEYATDGRETLCRYDNRRSSDSRAPYTSPTVTATTTIYTHTRQQPSLARLTYIRSCP